MKNSEYEIRITVSKINGFLGTECFAESVYFLSLKEANAAFSKLKKVLTNTQLKIRKESL